MTTQSQPKEPDIPNLDQELQQTIAQVLQQGENHYKAGQIQAAEDLFRAILEIQPDNPEANHNLGVLSVHAQQLPAGLSYFRTSVAANPQCAQYWLSYIEALILSDQIDAANQALQLGLQHGLQGTAVEELSKRLQDIQHPANQAETAPPITATTPISTHGETDLPLPKAQPAKPSKKPSRQDIKRIADLQRKGKDSAIEQCARDLIARFPAHGLGWKTLGVVLNRQRRVDDALEALRKALELFPEDSGLHNDSGLILDRKGLSSEAETHFRKALEIQPDLIAALSNLGNLLRTQGRLADSEATFRRALQLQSDAILYNNLGTTLMDQDRIVEAEASYRQALKISPHFALAHVNLGISLRKQGRLDEAVDCQRRALRLSPDNTEQHSNLLFTLNYTSSSTNLFHLEEAKKYGHMVRRKVKNPFPTWLCAAHPERLRVGIVSGDLYNHPVGFFLESILGKLDSNRLELIAYPSNRKTDGLTDRLKACFNAWKPIFALGDEAAARMIHADGIHVLLDLSGHTSHNRLPMFVWKPAPVQAGWLGYFATTGVSEIDYVLVDEVGVPDSQKENFTEALWYLPETRLCFSPPSLDVPVTPLPALARGYITFGSFQLLTKVGDEVLKLWSSILKVLPEAKLRWQCRQFGDPAVVEEVHKRLKHFDINSSRVSLHGSMNRVDYLKAHGDVDLILDTFPFPGGTTTCEALWMGVPTVTLAGSSLLSRQGASLLTAAGLQDLIATSEEDYVQKAIAMAGDIQKLSDLRAGMRAKVLSSPLYDAERFARNFESALWGMWQKNRPSERLLTQTDPINARATPEEKPVMNFFNPVFWGTKDPELFTDLMRKAAEQTDAYHFGDNMFLFQRNNSMLNDLQFMQSWENNVITPPDRTIIWRRYILAMAGFHCQHLEGDFVECGAYQGTGAKTVIDYLGGKDFKKTFWLYDLFEHNKKMANHPMQGHGPELHAQVVKRFKGYANVKIFKGILPEVLQQGCPEKIAYLHLDLNQAPAEIATLDALFDLVVPGGMIILDDYEMVFYRQQKLAEDIWFGKRGYKVFPLPTSQGFVLKR